MAGSATITVNPLPAVFDVTGGGSFCDGSAGANIGLSNSETGVNYQLMSGTANVGSVVAGTGQAISFGLQASVGTYTVVAVSAAGGCTSNMNGNAVLTTSPLPAVFVVTGGGGYCAGGTGVGIGLGGSEKEVSYQLVNGTTAVGDKVAGTGAALDFGLQTAAGTYTVVATNAIGCTSTMTESAKVIINPAPAAFRMTGGGSYCDGTQQEFNIGLDSSEKEVSYQLMNGGAKVGDAIAGTGEALSFGAHTEGGTYTVIATNPQGGCSTTMTGSAVITVNPSPKPFDVSTKGPISPNGTTITVSNSEIGVTYTLMLADKKVADAPGTGKIIGYPTQIALGIYTVIAVNDKSGCTTTMNGNVTIQGG
jgi:hypothetical protein